MKTRILELLKKLTSIKGVILIFSCAVFIVTNKLPVEYFIGIIGIIVADRSFEKVIRKKDANKEINRTISLGK